MQFHNPSPRRCGFTLIELLVVISIIALLIGILLPALGAARDVARKLAGLSNLRGLGQITHVYANDYGTLPGPLSNGHFIVYYHNQKAQLGFVLRDYYQYEGGPGGVPNKTVIEALAPPAFVAQVDGFDDFHAYYAVNNIDTQNGPNTDPSNPGRLKPWGDPPPNTTPPPPLTADNVPKPLHLIPRPAEQAALMDYDEKLLRPVPDAPGTWGPPVGTGDRVIDEPLFDTRNYMFFDGHGETLELDANVPGEF